jgi:hypothetical protein
MAQTVRLAVLCEMDFRSAPLFVWTGPYTLTWQGNDFLGTGTLANVSKIAEMSDGSAQGISLSMSNVPASILAAALDENYQGQAVKLWLACFDANWSLLDDPYMIFKGLMDVMTVQDGNPTGAVSITAESRMIELNRPRIRRYTANDQAIDFPNDQGFDFVDGIQLVQVYWGNPNGPSAQLPGSGAQIQNITS